MNRRSNRSQGRGSRRRRAKRNGRNASRQGQRNNTLVRLTKPGLFCPDRMFVNLIWQDQTTFRSLLIAPQSNFAIRSSAYDPDSAFGSGAIPGFVELANLYKMYKVHEMSSTWTVGNHEVGAISICSWPSNVLQNTNSLGITDIVEYNSNAGGARRMLGRDSGQSVGTVRTRAKGNSLVGPIFNTDLDYSSSTSSNPVTMWGINFAYYNGLGTNFSFAVNSDLKIVYTVEFFERRQLES